uniref:Uncharacterized protein n=1 Tax=Ursus maritimus TaxID=29073 RepID=A0A452TTT9_URSMA
MEWTGHASGGEADLGLCEGPRERWGAVALATSPFPLKQSLEVRIEGTLGLGVLAGKGVPCHPGGQRSTLPPAGPGCSELKCPGPWGRPGHPLGIGIACSHDNHKCPQALPSVP